MSFFWELKSSCGIVKTSHLKPIEFGEAGEEQNGGQIAPSKVDFYQLLDQICPAHPDWCIVGACGYLLIEFVLFCEQSSHLSWQASPTFTVSRLFAASEFTLFCLESLLESIQLYFVQGNRKNH